VEEIRNLEGDEGEEGLALYRTSDLYFAAYLCALDVHMIGTEDESLPTNRKKVWFVFKLKRMDVKKLKTSFFSGEGKVRGKLYADRIRSLKQLCFV